MTRLEQIHNNIVHMILHGHGHFNMVFKWQQQVVIFLMSKVQETPEADLDRRMKDYCFFLNI